MFLNLFSYHFSKELFETTPRFMWSTILADSINETSSTRIGFKNIISSHDVTNIHFNIFSLKNKKTTTKISFFVNKFYCEDQASRYTQSDI